jgi:hypothetical protein
MEKEKEKKPETKSSNEPVEIEPDPVLESVFKKAENGNK